MNSAVLHTAQTRYTTKHYDEQDTLSPEELDAVLEILRLTPSSMNIQPWHFYVFDRASAREQLLPYVKDFNIERVANASHVIVMAAKTTIDDAWCQKVLDNEAQAGRFPEDFDIEGFGAFRRQGVTNYFSGYDHGEIWVREQVHIALGFLLYAAPQLGIDTTALGGMKFREFDKAFGLPEKGEKAAVAIALGRRTADDSNASRPKARLSREELFTLFTR